MTEQLSFSDAMKHKGVVTEIAANATTEGREVGLAVIYDELVRLHWENEHGKMPDSFNLSAVAGAHDEDRLRRARALFDAGKVTQVFMPSLLLLRVLVGLSL